VIPPGDLSRMSAGELLALAGSFYRHLLGAMRMLDAAGGKLSPKAYAECVQTIALIDEATRRVPEWEAALGGLHRRAKELMARIAPEGAN